MKTTSTEKQYQIIWTHNVGQVAGSETKRDTGYKSCKKNEHRLQHQHI